MNNKFDQLAKSVAQSVTRRQALRRFGLGLATIALAGFGFDALANTCKASGLTCDPDGGEFSGGSCSRCCSGLYVCKTDKNGNLHCVCD